MKPQIAWDKEVIQGLIEVGIINVADKYGNVIENLDEDTWTGDLRIYAISGLTFDVVNITDDTWYCQVAERTLLRCKSSRPIKARGASGDFSIYPGQDVRFAQFIDGTEMTVCFYHQGDNTPSQIITAIVESRHFEIAPSQ